MNLKDKVVIVTGSRRGIGYHIAKAFAAEKAHVVICSTTQEGSETVAKELAETYQIQTLGLKTDVGNFKEVQNLVEKTQEKFGKIDILINNAGVTRDNLLLRMDEEQWDTVIQTNLNSVFYATKAVIRQMLKQKYGRIINISSVVGVMGNAGQSNYAAAKAGIIGFTKSIAKEYGAKGITCNAVAPGFIRSDMTASLPKEYLDNIIAMLPQKRLGKPEDVASVVLFLASDGADYITGQVINVDGGMVM